MVRADFFFLSSGGPPGSYATLLAVVTPLDSSTKNEIITAIGGFVFDVAAGNDSVREWVEDSRKLWMQQQKREKSGQASRALSRRATRGKRRRQESNKAERDPKLSYARDFQVIDTVVELTKAISAEQLKVPFALMIVTETTAETKGGQPRVRISSDVLSRLSPDDFANRESMPPYLVVVKWKGKMRQVGHFTLYVFRFQVDRVTVAVYDPFNNARVDEKADEQQAEQLLRKFFGKGRGSDKGKTMKKAWLDAVMGRFVDGVPVEIVPWSRMADFRLVQTHGDGVSCGYQTLLTLLLLVLKCPAHVSSAIQGKAFVTPTPLLFLVQSLVTEVTDRLTGTVLGQRVDEEADTTTVTSTTTTTATGHDLVAFD